MDVLFLVCFFRLYPLLKVSFEKTSVRKNLFLSACVCWDYRLSLREMNQILKLGGTIGYGDSYLDTWSFFCHFKAFRLHAILHDAAGAVRAHSGKGPGDCYMIGREPNFCVLGQVTRPLVCFYVKLFLPYIFNYFDFWSRMSLIVLDKELTEKNIIKELGLFIDGPPQGYWYSFCPPTTFKPNEQTTRNTSHPHAIAWSRGKLDYDKLFAVFCDTKVTNAEVSAKGLEKCRLLTRLIGQNVEKLDD